MRLADMGRAVKLANERQLKVNEMVILESAEFAEIKITSKNGGSPWLANLMDYRDDMPLSSLYRLIVASVRLHVQARLKEIDRELLALGVEP